jgi:DAACS family dicarboxylate/amino acid:cation (Na+ or H+) symporter
MRRVPLYIRILVGVAMGALLGVAFGERPILLHVTNRHLGDLGLLVIRLLKALAVPLIFFAIVDAFVRTHISARAGLRMVLICLLNVSVAMAIGLTIMNLWRPGEAWRGQFTELVGHTKAEGAPAAPGATLGDGAEGTSTAPSAMFATGRARTTPAS